MSKEEFVNGCTCGQCDGSCNPVAWQLEWRDDGTAVSKRDTDAYYRVAPLSVLHDVDDFEVEWIGTDSTTYIGIFRGFERARAAAEYFEMNGELPPRLRATPRARRKDRSMEIPSVLAWALAIFLVFGLVVVCLAMSGTPFR